MTIDIQSVFGWAEIQEKALVPCSDGKERILSEAMAFEIEKVSKAAIAAKKSSSISLTLKFDPDTARNEMGIQPALKVKMPLVHAKRVDCFFDSRNNLYGENPDQQKLELKGNKEHFKGGKND